MTDDTTANTRVSGSGTGSRRRRAVANTTQAAMFLDWMQAHEFHGSHVLHGNGGLWAFYEWWAAEEGVELLTETMFCRAFNQIVKREEKRFPQTAGPPRRLTVYLIDPLPDEAEEPHRMAA